MFMDTPPLLKAQAGSGIENIVITTDRLLQHLGSKGRVADLATAGRVNLFEGVGSSRRPARAEGRTGKTACSSQADDTAHDR